MSHRGRLLVATPLIGDPMFERTVILIVAHDAEGAFGLVLNRPSDTTVGAIAPEWSAQASAPAVVYQGGPVNRGSVILLARSEESDGFEPVVGDCGTVMVGSDDDRDAVLSTCRALRVFAGSSGWAPGQLEDEIREGAWWVLDAEPGDPVTEDPSGLWRRVLQRQPGELAWFANYPEDPCAN